MKKILPVLFISMIHLSSIIAQTVDLKGKPMTEIFTDFHYYLNDTTKITGFGVTRAYLGYTYLPEGDFSSTIIINVGTPEDLVAGARPRRYSYFREASIKYTKENLNITFGIASTRIFEFQQKFWGKRYVASEYQSRFGYGYVADLGIVLDYKINDIFKIDFALMNGQGYSNIQVDGSLKKSFGMTITPVKQISVRLYADFMKPRGIQQTTLIAFAGFKNDLIYFGGEASYKSNIDITEGHDAWGLSGTGGIKISEKAEIFARYDYCTSVMLPGGIIQWNYKTDGSFIIGGLQYTINPYIRVAFNYQGTYPFNPGNQISDAFFINAHFKF